MRYVAIYVRKSRLNDDNGIELDKQVELLTEYAEEQGYTYDIYKEQGSSEDWNRPEFQRMITMIKKDAYSGVLVTDLDRVTRDRTDFGLFTRLLTEHEMKLVTLTKTYDFEQDDDLFISGIQSEMDNQFMRITKRKLTRGKYQAVNSGTWIGVAPLGYKKDGKTKRLIPAQDSTEELVRLAYDRFIANTPVVDICKEIEARGLSPNGRNYINDSTVRKILKNPVYIGTLKYKKPDGSYIHLQDIYEPLISKEVFYKAQEIWEGRGKMPVKSNAKHPLSGLIKCAKCGNSLTTSNPQGKDSSRKGLYKSISTCKSSQHRIRKNSFNGCDNKSIQYNRIQEAVTNAIRDDIKTVDDEILKITLGEQDVSEDELKVEQLKSNLSNLETQKKKVQQGFISGIFDEQESQEQISELNDKIQAVKYSLANTTVKDSSERLVELKDMRDWMEEAIVIDWFKDAHRTNRLLKSFIEVIYYSKDEADTRVQKKPFEIAVKYK